MATQLTPTAADDLHAGITAICHTAGLDPSRARLIKWTMNAVYALGPHVIRMSRGDHAKHMAHRLTRVATALNDCGAPVIELAEMPQPVEAGEWVATIWQRVPSIGEPQPVDLATPLRAIHAIDDLPGPLPNWNILAKCRQRITSALTGAHAAQLDQWSRTELRLPAAQLTDVLRARADQIEQQLAAVQWYLPHGVIHGDAHSGNLILPSTPTRPGPAPDTVICDLDSVSTGPREWDLVPTAHGHIRFGRNRTHHEQFAAAYGFDLLAWPGWPVLRDLRELQLVTSVLDNAHGRPEVARQLGHRLRSYLSGANDVVWTRYE